MEQIMLHVPIVRVHATQKVLSLEFGVIDSSKR
jgi:hypothetical protein